MPANRNNLILRYVEKAVASDYQNFITFLKCLNQVGKYNCLVARIKDELYK